jgi:hypothetical protein
MRKNEQRNILLLQYKERLISSFMLIAQGPIWLHQIHRKRIEAAINEVLTSRPEKIYSDLFLLLSNEYPDYSEEINICKELTLLAKKTLEHRIELLEN